MAAKHARHDMREDKNFKGTDPSETTAQYLYCDTGHASDSMSQQSRPTMSMAMSQQSIPTISMVKTLACEVVRKVAYSGDHCHHATCQASS